MNLVFLSGLLLDSHFDTNLIHYFSLNVCLSFCSYDRRSHFSFSSLYDSDTKGQKMWNKETFVKINKLHSFQYKHYGWFGQNKSQNSAMSFEHCDCIISQFHKILVFKSQNRRNFY